MDKFVIIVFILLTIAVNKLFSQDFARGADVSWLSEMEAANVQFYNDAGAKQDVLQILQDHCINSIRLRVWVNPVNGWSSKKDMVTLAQRAQKRGMRIMVDFHYSDSWADPGQQTKPVQWVAYSTDQLSKAIYDHTYNVLDTLRRLGITPEWCQIGNETNNGMLWENGKASTNMANYARFVTSGNNAAHAVFPAIKTIVHLANAYDKSLYQWNIGGLISNGAVFDVIGMSLYPDSTSWQNTNTQCLDNMKNLISLYGKPIIISEIGMIWNYSKVQSFVEDVISKVSSLPSNKGLGVFWWEPECYNWNYYDKGAWNPNTRRPTTALDGFLAKCSPKMVTVTFVADFRSSTRNGYAYITGNMTGVNGAWTIDSMGVAGQTAYSISYKLPAGSSGAYYLLTSRNWTDRETIPAACAVWYSTDRGYQVGSNDTTIYLTWASCTTTFDCAGIMNGTATIDACGVCSGGTTNITPCSVQSVTLKKGWNLISTNIRTADSSIATLFKNLDVQEIKNMDAFWLKGQSSVFNGLQKLNPGEGYLVNMNVAGTLSVTGTPVSSSNFQINALSNWTLIGCPYQTATAFSSIFNAGNCSAIKNLDGFWMPNGTTNSIQTFEPGKGYFIKLP